jgi:hypothetical protein
VTDPRAIPRDPNTTQQLRHLGKRLSLDPNELSRRVQQPSCVLCSGALSYVRFYFEHHQCCPACEAKLDTQTVALLAKLRDYL